MPITIDPTIDTFPIPAKVYKDFVDKLITVYDKDKLKSIGINEAEVNKVLAVLKTIKANSDANLKDNDPPVYFHQGWNPVFETAGEELNGDKLFAVLEQKEIVDLEKNSRVFLQQIKDLQGRISKAAKDANDESELVIKSFKSLNDAVEAANKAGAGSSPPAASPAPGQPGGPALGSKEALAWAWNDVTTKTGTSPLTGISAPPAPPADLTVWLNQAKPLLLSALSSTPPDPKIINILSTAGINSTSLSALSESTLKKIQEAKKLYKYGFITENEYLALLFEAKKLMEQVTKVTQKVIPVGSPTPSPVPSPATAPAPSPTPTPAPSSTPSPAPSSTAAAAQAKFGTFIANIVSPTKDTAFKNGYVALLTEMQDIFAKLNKKVINESQQKLIKAYIKKRILQEAVKTENKKEYLNEVLGLLIGGILLALAAWVAKKFSENFKSGPARYYDIDPEFTRYGGGPTQNDKSNLAGEIHKDPVTGQVRDARNNPVNPDAQKIALEKYRDSIADAISKYDNNMTQIKGFNVADCGYDPTSITAVQAAVTNLVPTLAKGKALIPELQAYINTL